MGARVIVGAQWGDEGKGKIVDIMAAGARYVVRFQGGNNAGHTLVVRSGGPKVVLHLLPSGALRDGVVCALTSGVVIDPGVLIGEIEALSERGISMGPERLRIASGASVILAHHVALDAARERARGAERIGTTGRGIGPAYEDRVARRALVMRDLLDAKALSAKLDALLPEKCAALAHYGAPLPDRAELEERCLAWGERLGPHLDDVGRLVREAVERGAGVLFEGAQGAMLDVELGTYPFVTSSHTTSLGACLSTGIGPAEISEVIAIAKAYCTRVGAGPFPTEELGAAGQRMRDVGAEFGSTTGRPRRCGWLDAVALRYALRMNGAHRLAITKLDVLDGFESIKICRAWRGRGGQVWEEAPSDPGAWGEAEPIYEEFEGWQTPTSAARSIGELPSAARAYLERVEGLCGVPIGIVSVGPAREQTFEVERQGEV